MSFEGFDGREGVIVLCPVCSHPPLLEVRPSWGFARHTSRREGNRFWIWIPACQHAAAVDPKRVIPDDGRAEIEARWVAESVKAFEAHTQHWKPEHREMRREKFFENRALQEAKKEPNMVPDETKPNEHDENELPDPVP